MKRIVAIFLVVAIVFSVTSCKINENEDKAYFVDEEGQTQYVEKDEDGNYYYTDSEGVTSVIEDEKYLEQIKDAEEQIAQEGIQQLVDGGIDKVTEKADEDDKLQISDGLIQDGNKEDNKGNNKEENKVDSTSSAKTEALARISEYQKILKTKKYTIKGTVKQFDGESMEYPVTYIRNGEDFFIEAAIPFEEGKVVKANMIYVKGVAYCYIPSMKVYYNAGSDLGDDMGVGAFSDNVVEDYTFVETSNITISGKSYICDKYTYDGTTYNYVYDTKGNLVRIEEVYSKNSYVIAEIKSLSPTADTSKIKKPKGIDITSMIG